MYTNPIHPESDKHLISPYSISLESGINTVRLKETVTNSKALD